MFKSNMASEISTEHIYTDNGVDANGNGISVNPIGYWWMSWDNSSWEITFPVAIKNVLEIDLTTMSGVTIRNGTKSFDGALRLFAFDESGRLVGSRSSSTVRRLSTVPISSLGVLKLNGVTVKSIKLLGPSNTGPNLSLLGVVEGVTTFTVVNQGYVESIQAVEIGSTSISVQVQGDPSETYELVAVNQTIENMKAGDIMNFTDLQSSTDYTFQLMKPAAKITRIKTIIIRSNGSHPLSLAEVQVYSTSGVNVATSGVATQSSTAHGGSASRAIDGNTSGNYGHGTVSHTRTSSSEWWRLVLSTAVEVDRIVVWNRTDCCGERLGGTTMEIYDESNVLFSTVTLGPDRSQVVHMSNL